MVHTVNRVTKQIVSAILAVGVLVGSVLLIIYEVGPLWKSYSAFGILGVILGLVIILGMLKNIWKGDYDRKLD